MSRRFVSKSMLQRSLVAWVPLLALLLSGSYLPAQQPAVVDWKLETTAPWQPRDSQAEYVFENRLWIAGGWFD